MTDKERQPPTSAAELRRRAEQRFSEKMAGEQPVLSDVEKQDTEKQRLIHELEVHQIELEMQNAELRQARDEAEILLEQYTDLYDFAPVGYATLDRNGEIRAINLTGAELLGIERSLLIGRRFGEHLAPEQLSAFADFLEKVFISPAKESCELTLNKEPRFVQIKALAAQSGQECRIALIDISAHRELEENLRILRDLLAARAVELESANSELEAFNYTVSHDLRSPLTTINCLCQSIQSRCGKQLDESCQEHVQDILDCTQHMNQLITALIKFSRISHRDINKKKVDLSALVQMVAAERQMADPQRQVRFQIPDGITGKGDPDLLSIVLDNLIGNAWKYSAPQQELSIEFGQTENDGQKIYFIKDNGPGFPTAESEKLFEPFQRLPGAEVKGHGIGLATVKRIIVRHGGKVWAESAPGQGATFFFSLE